MVEVARQAGVFGSEAWCNWFFSLSLGQRLVFSVRALRSLALAR